MKLPTLTKLVETADWTAWKAELPGMPSQPNGWTYRVTSYPNGEVHVTSWVRNTRVINARRIEQIVAGLKHGTA